MTNLECCVCICKYNENNCCCKSEIMVGNKTECDSFVRIRENAKNVVNTPNPELTINCDAEDCVYNANKKCSAKHVGISGNVAACITYKEK